MNVYYNQIGYELFPAEFVYAGIFLRIMIGVDRVTLFMDSPACIMVLALYLHNYTFDFTIVNEVRKVRSKNEYNMHKLNASN